MMCLQYCVLRPAHPWQFTFAPDRQPFSVQHHTAATSWIKLEKWDGAQPHAQAWWERPSKPRKPPIERMPHNPFHRCQEAKTWWGNSPSRRPCREEFPSLSTPQHAASASSQKGKRSPCAEVVFHGWMQLYCCAAGVQGARWTYVEADCLGASSACVCCEIIYHSGYGLWRSLACVSCEITHHRGYALRWTPLSGTNGYTIKELFFSTKWEETQFVATRLRSSIV